MALDYSDKDRFLSGVARRINLREGPPRVERIVRAIFDHDHEPGAEALTERVLARITRLPVPVIEAVRRELEAAGMLEPGLSIQMSPAALRTLGEQWGWFAQGGAAQSEFDATPATLEAAPAASIDAEIEAAPTPQSPQSPQEAPSSTPPLQRTRQLCEVCGGTGIAPQGDAWQSVRAGLEKYFAGKPRKVQAGGVGARTTPPTPETNLRRAALLQEYGALAGKDVLVMGEEVSVAAAVALLGKALVPGGRLARRIVALHPDDAVLRQLRDIAVSEGAIIGLVTHDPQRPLIPDLQGEFDTVFAVSPPAFEAMLLLLNHAVDALKPGGQLFLSYPSYPQSDLAELLDVQREMLELGLVILRMLPRSDGSPAGARDLYVLHLVDEGSSLATHHPQPPQGNGIR